MIFIQVKAKHYTTVTGKPFFTKTRHTVNLAENIEEEPIKFFKDFFDP